MLQERLLERLVQRRVLLVTTALVFVGLVVFAGLGAFAGAIGYAVILVVAALAPVPAGGAMGEGSDTPGDLTRNAAVNAFADALADPCIILDRRSMVTHANAAAIQEFPSTRPGEPVGLSLRLPALLGAIERARETGAPQVAELHRTVPSESWHRIDIAPLGVAGEGTLVLTLRNQTEQKRVDALRSDFIANASHELRTPLTSLVGFIDTLLGPASRDAAARERFLVLMRGQAARMSKLIDDLLSLSRIEMRQHMRPTGQVDLGALLREVREGLQTQAGEAGVEVALDGPESDVVVTGDRDELYEVFENLLDNAIKYGGGGGRVDVRLREARRLGIDVAVEVTDYGAGVAAEHVPRLTERFYRVDAESSRRKKGTGLGLAIVKHIVQRHRGSLTIRSRPGEGTTVEVGLPR